MDVVGQNADRNCLERIVLLDETVREPQEINMPDQKITGSIR